MVEVVLALGSNLGDRRSYLESAVARLEKSVVVDAVSSWWENRAVGGPAGQGDFLNGALLGRTELEPQALLTFIKDIEVDLGRDLGAEHWSARVIDIDIIFYGDQRIASERLTVPHPRMQERDFVLIPLKEICPGYMHPVLKLEVGQLFSGLGTA